MKKIVCIILSMLSVYLLTAPNSVYAATGDETQIMSGYAAAVAAYNNRDINTFMSYVSYACLDGGENYNDWMEDLESEFVSPDFQQITGYTINSLVVTGNTAKMSVTTTYASGIIETEVEYFIKEGDNWKFYGNQERHDICIFSAHFSSGYYAEIYVDDPDGQITSATVTGPGITDTMYLQYASGQWYHHPYTPFISAFVPESPQIYTLQITDLTGTYTYQKTITGYVIDFATNLSPSGNATGEITFAWTGISGAQRVQVQLDDGQHQRLWNSDDLPNTTTSVVYDGPALNSCQTYLYYVASKVDTEDVVNQSLAEGSFYYGYCPQITFNDVLSDHWAYDYINAIYNAGITTGCAQDDPDTPENERSYSPGDNVTREQMAAFIIRAMHGETFSYTPTPYFTDVPSSHWAFKYIQKLKELGITTGCGYDQYCPDDMVTRDQMAAFLIRAKVGEDFSYEQGPYFTDVLSDHWAFDYIQKLKELGITTGCGSGQYCPNEMVTRDQMAAFLYRAFLQ